MADLIRECIEALETLAEDAAEAGYFVRARRNDMDQVNNIVREYLGGDCTEQDAELVIAFALAIYQEQLDLGLGDADEFATRANVMDWLHARTYDWTRLYEAATGDVGAIVEVRTEAGVPVL
jgi:hypothetical protein